MKDCIGNELRIGQEVVISVTDSLALGTVIDIKPSYVSVQVRNVMFSVSSNQVAVIDSPNRSFLNTTWKDQDGYL